MSTRILTVAMLAAMTALTASSAMLAAPIAVVDPGFDAFVAGTMLSTPIADDRVLANITGGLSNVPLNRAENLFGGPTGELADTPVGWTTTTPTQTGRLQLNSAFPAGGGTVKGFVNSTANASQAFAGMGVLPNSTYTLTIEVSDARINDVLLGDYSVLPPTVEARLFAGGMSGTDLGGVVSFSPPGNGGTALYSRTVTTGAVVPSGDLTIVLTAAGAVTGPGLIVIGTAYFDNTTLNVTTIPEPAGLSLVGLAGMAMLLVRRRVAA